MTFFSLLTSNETNEVSFVAMTMVSGPATETYRSNELPFLAKQPKRIVFVTPFGFSSSSSHSSWLAVLGVDTGPQAHRFVPTRNLISLSRCETRRVGEFLGVVNRSQGLQWRGLRTGLLMPSWWVRLAPPFLSSPSFILSSFLVICEMGTGSPNPAKIRNFH